MPTPLRANSLNASYYRWPVDHTFVRWHRRLPEGFQMSVKAPRGLTHFKRLYEPERWLTHMRRGLRYLERKRGFFRLLAEITGSTP